MPTAGWLRRVDLPLDAKGRSYIDPANLDQILDQFINWRGDVNGGGHTLINVALSGNLQIGGSVLFYGGLTNSSPRPPVAAGTLTYGELRATGPAAYNDDGFLRISAGGGNSASQKTYIDISGFNAAVPDMDNAIVFGTRGVERLRLMSNPSIAFQVAVQMILSYAVGAANDAGAAAAGCPMYGVYHNAGVLRVRIT